MIGQELGGRYEIITRVGGGGMALVYKAHDILLNRNVAIKVLRQQFVHDEDFIRRFQREAQSAASLSHPNVVSIYDVGREGDIHYIVMEYIEGTNLNEKIKEHAPLQVEEAVHIASQICDALDHAHHNQIIHRDIKPHNILIGKNGRVKVTDFGIARAATSSDITQTGSVIGSVHYFSPEHAKGVSQGEQSDIYSLGIVLYQMLTGRLPFLGESPISIALKHLQEEVEEPRKVNPLIPQSVENIILKAMRKSKDERYASARQMLDDLESCLLPDKRNEPKIVFEREEDDSDEERTRVIPAIRPTRLSGETDQDRETLVHWNGMEKKKRKWVAPAVWSIVIAVLLFATGYGIGYVKDKLRVPEVAVPNVVSMDVADAQHLLEEAELMAQPDYVFNRDVEKDFVVSQEKAGETVKTGTPIRFTVSKGPELKVMKSYMGEKINDAKMELQSVVTEDQIQIVQMTSDQPEGTVIHQSPVANEEFDPYKAVVTLTVSQGLGTVKVPDLKGLKQSEAEATLRKANLIPRVEKGKSFVDEGLVYKQFPYEPNTQAEVGSEVTIYVSAGFPEDAIEGVSNVSVKPTQEGVKTVIKILISDSRGEHVDWGTREITTATSFPVMVVLSDSTHNAVISIYQNDIPIDSVTMTYKDVQRQREQYVQPDRQTQAEESPTPLPTANADNAGDAGAGTNP